MIKNRHGESGLSLELVKVVWFRWSLTGGESERKRWEGLGMAG